jgi:hypothetical protein
MEPVEAQEQAMAHQMAQIANLLENDLRIQPSPTPIPNDNQYASSAPGTLLSKTRTSHPVHQLRSQAAFTAIVTDRSYSPTISVASSLPPTPHQPHPDPQVSMTAHSSTPLGDALFRTDPRPTMTTTCENSQNRDGDERHLTVTTPEAEPLEIGPNLEDQYVAVNYTSVRFPGWEHDGTRLIQIHTLNDSFYCSSHECSLGIPVDPKADDVLAPLLGYLIPGTGDDH